MTAELISVSLTVAVVWLMVEYGLNVHLTQNIKEWAKNLLQSSSDKKEENDPDDAAEESARDKNATMESDEGQSKVEANSSIDQSNTVDGNKKHQARHRKLFGIKGTPKAPDVEKGTENGK